MLFILFFFQVGEENCKPALSLIKYDKNLQNAMEFIFGNVFICKDMNIAKTVTFHDRIKRKCVTLDGDITDPSGTLSGGAPQKGGSVLLQLSEMQQYEVIITFVTYNMIHNVLLFSCFFFSTVNYFFSILCIKQVVNVYKLCYYYFNQILF